MRTRTTTDERILMFSAIFERLVPLLRNKGLYKYRIIQKIYKKCREVSIPDYVTVFGNKFFIGINDDLDIFIKNESYEKEISQFVIDNICEGDNIVDVGANIGFFTLLFGKIVGETGYVYAFEPELNNFKLLKQNVNENKFHNIEIIQKVVSEKKGKIKFVIEDTSVSHYVVSDLNQPDKKNNIIELDSVTLDNYITKPIKLIKIDVEGHEIKVLNGMKSLIKQNKDLSLIIEFNIFTQRRAGYTGNDLFAFIEELGFDIFHMGDNKKIITPVTDKDILELDGANLLCKRNSSQK